MFNLNYKYWFFIIICSIPTFSHAETFVVLGTGQDTYYIYDEFGRDGKGSATLGKEMQLPVGNYVVRLNSYNQPFSIQTGQKTTIQTGTLTVSGIGLDTFSVYDKFANCCGLLTALTNKEISLLPDTYTVRLRGIDQLVKVESGQKTIVQAGLLSVAGIGLDEYKVYDSFNQTNLVNNITNKWVELFAGDYVVRINGSWKKTTVKATEKTILTAGSVFVVGYGLNNYDVSGDAIIYTYNSARSTNKEMELFSGNYNIFVSYTSVPVIIQEKQRTILKTGLLKLPETVKERFDVYDLQSKSLYTGNPSTPREMFAGTYKIKEYNGYYLSGVENTITVVSTDANPPAPITPSTPLIPNTATSTTLLTYNEGINAGIAQCKANPVSCGITINANTDGSTADGMAKCKADPASCGISVNSNTSNTTNTVTIYATYDFNTGELYIPMLGVADLFGVEHFYEVYLKQKDKTLDFSVDVSRLKPFSK
jgi:hypothetical protein